MVCFRTRFHLFLNQYWIWSTQEELPSLQQPHWHLLFKMGCTAGQLACQPQPSSSTNQEGQTHEGAAKVPEVLSSLERLSQATGGMEKSWYRCIFPFGIISLVIGIAGTGVTYTYNDLPQTKVVSVVLLIAGLVLVVMATACWTAHKRKRRKKKEGGTFTTDQCPLWEKTLLTDNITRWYHLAFCLAFCFAKRSMCSLR